MKIMIVDDEKPIRQWFEYIVKDLEDAEICGSFSNGKAALEACGCELPDIIFTDIIMPVMNGIELIQKVKQEFPQVEIIILSNFNDFDYVHKGLKLGARDYLLKVQSDDSDIVRFITEIQKERSGTQHQREIADSELTKLLSDCVAELELHAIHLPAEGSTEYDGIKKQIADALTTYRDSPSMLYSSFVVNQMIDYVDKHYDQPIKLSSLAEQFNYNSDYLSQMFKKHTGNNFNAYVTQVRMNKAKAMLLVPDALVKDVAAAVGYSSEMYFSTAFKNFCGMSPRLYAEEALLTLQRKPKENKEFL